MAKAVSLRSVYMKIYYHIIDDIMNGYYDMGDIIPTQNELAARFNVSRVTVREAVKELARRGVLKTVKGKGTYVTAKPGEIGSNERTAGFSKTRFTNMGREVRSRIIDIEVVPADKKLSACLMVPQFTLLTHIIRVRLVDERPMCVDDVYIVNRYVKNLDFHHENLETGSLYSLLKEKAGIVLDSIEEKFRAVNCPDEIAKYLEINAGEPVLKIKRISYDETGKAIEYCENHERSDLYYTVIHSKRTNGETVSAEQYNKILGSILGAAVGDAMGAVTETRTTQMIKQRFGGFVEDLVPPPDDCFVRGRGAGSVTDDFSLAYFTAVELVKCAGAVDTEVAVNSVLAWSEYPEFFNLAGSTTQAAILKLKGEALPDKRYYLACDNIKATNGSAMKIFPVGLINPGNLDKAVQDAATVCMPTHPYDVTIAAGAAVAAAVAKAIENDASLDEVLKAGIYGAQKGLLLGRKMGKPLAAPSIEKRIRLAIDIGRQGLGWEETMMELADIIGAGLPAAEAIPCAFGILAANPGDTMGAIKMGVNIGGDTDTVATIVGAMAGALYGAKTIPARFLGTINRENGFKLEGLAQDIATRYYSKKQV